MKRLTIRHSDGRVSQPSTTDISVLIYRLAAYEDTGLEPEEIITGKELAEIACGLELLKKYQELGNVDCLRELVEADKEGRLIILPVREGESLWIYGRAGKPQEMVLVAPDIRCRCKDDDLYCELACSQEKRKYCLMHLPSELSYLNKTVFLTREAAEAALKEREQNE